jgi:cytochrome P450
MDGVSSEVEHAWTERLWSPYDFYDELLAGGPVHELPEDDGYMITRYEDIVWAARHPEIFTSKRVRYDEDDPEAAAIAADGYPSPATVNDNDPPEHTRYRDVAFDAFSPKRVPAYEPMIRRISDELIDTFVERGGVEFVDEFCRRLPIAVICELLGLPRDSADDLRRWADARTELLGKYVPRAQALELQRLGVEFEQFLAREIEARRVDPREDVLTEMIQTTPDPSIECGLPHLVAMAKIMVSAGTETTTYLLASALWLLLTHEGSYDEVALNPGLISPLLEETLRYESPSQWSQRRCVTDTVIGGTLIPAGARVLLTWGSGNRDATLFSEAKEFDLARSNVRRHLGFGIGPHTCVGAPLARLEGKVALEQVLSRLKNLRLDAGNHEPSWLEITAAHGLSELRLHFDPGAKS